MILIAWGVRMMTHRGEDRAVSRSIFAPIAVAMMSVTAAAHEPAETWNHSFGLGGHVRRYRPWLASWASFPATGSVSLAMSWSAADPLAAMRRFLLFVLGFDRVELSTLSP